MNPDYGTLSKPTGLSSSSMPMLLKVKTARELFQATETKETQKQCTSRLVSAQDNKPAGGEGWGQCDSESTMCPTADNTVGFDSLGVVVGQSSHRTHPKRRYRP